LLSAVLTRPFPCFLNRAPPSQNSRQLASKFTLQSYSPDLHRRQNTKFR
jgi:hypothetical protein